ncbi:MAG: hypothetical protein DRP00_02740 [Candidatus Aenigmatarchaeota archaeon]|nr:MAG: hypothetical protein DRP00_02740 [Candidatus Aenigmarchaeota archaeon]
MDYMLFAVGVSLIICGFVITYLLISSVMTFSQAVTQMQAEALRELVETKKNELTFSSIVGSAIILLGAILVGKAVKR